MVERSGPGQSEEDRQLDHWQWNQAMRGETPAQAADHQFNELLQELRVAQTGVQILFAFLLGLAFTPRFPDLRQVSVDEDCVTHPSGK
jgi:hypothetical protein